MFFSNGHHHHVGLRLHNPSIQLNQTLTFTSAEIKKKNFKHFLNKEYQLIVWSSLNCDEVFYALC